LCGVYLARSVLLKNNIRDVASRELFNQLAGYIDVDCAQLVALVCLIVFAVRINPFGLLTMVRISLVIRFRLLRIVYPLQFTQVVGLLLGSEKLNTTSGRNTPLLLT
jgi:hypothetical protein